MKRFALLIVGLLLAVQVQAAPSTVALSGTVWNLDCTLASGARVLFQNHYTQNLSVIDPPYLKTLITNSSGVIPTTNFLQSEYLSVAVDASPPKAIQMPTTSTADLATVLGGSSDTTASGTIIVLGPFDATMAGVPLTISPDTTFLAFTSSIDLSLTGSPVTADSNLSAINVLVPLDLTISGNPLLITQTSATPVPITITGTIYIGGNPIANARVGFTHKSVQTIGNGIIRQGSKTLITDSSGVMPATQFVQGETLTIQVMAPNAPVGPTQVVTLPFSASADLSSLLSIN